VIEAITEDLALKNALFKERTGCAVPAPSSPRTPRASRSTEMAAATKRADRFVGLHFFNPVPLMALVEVVRTVDDVGADVQTRLRVRRLAP